MEAFRDEENVYFDTSLGTKSAIEKFIDEIGCERIIFGSDVPFGTMNREIDKILSLDRGGRELRKVLHENARRLLKLED